MKQKPSIIIDLKESDTSKQVAKKTEKAIKAYDKKYQKLEKQIIKEFVEVFCYKFPRFKDYLIRISQEDSRKNGMHRYYGGRNGVADFVFFHQIKGLCHVFDSDSDDPFRTPKVIYPDTENKVLWLEFKREGIKKDGSKKWKQSGAQIAFQKTMENIGHKYAVCYSADEAIKAIEECLDN